MTAGSVTRFAPRSSRSPGARWLRTRRSRRIASGSSSLPIVPPRNSASRGPPPGAGGLHDRPGLLQQEGPFGAGRVVLGEPGDLLEQRGPPVVVEVLAGHLGRAPLEGYAQLVERGGLRVAVDHRRGPDRIADSALRMLESLQHLHPSRAAQAGGDFPEPRFVPVAEGWTLETRMRCPAPTAQHLVGAEPGS